MKKNRKALYLHSTILRGRLLKSPDEAGGAAGGDSGTGADNTPVNPDPAAAAGGDSNNAGPKVDPAGFWKDPAAPAGSTPTTPDPAESVDFGKSIAEDIAGFQAPEVFTGDIAKEIADGNLEGVNKALSSAIRSAVQQSVVIAAKIMQQFEGSLDGRIQSLIGNNQTAVGDEQLLKDSFPTYANPAMQGVIRGVFTQSLKHAGNDRTKALAMTKDMLKTMGQTGQQDFGIESAPRNPEDYLGDGPKSLVQSLLSME